MEINGLITKCVAGVYDIFCENGETVKAYARGKFRNNKVTPLVGDKVVVNISERNEDDNTIINIFERKNQLVRPPIANIDYLIITMAVTKPEPDLKLADYLICYCRLLNIEPLICINKDDYGYEKAQSIAKQYELSGIKVYITNTFDDNGIINLKNEIGDGITCLCGQSAVGKSSIMNKLAGKDLFEIGGLSRKTDRGKNTTRHIELIKISDNKWIADTPGFSLLDLPEISPEELKDLYYEFEKYSDGCRFIGCNHISEPDCSVKKALENGLISIERHERYKIIFDELNNKWRRRYD